MFSKTKPSTPSKTATANRASAPVALASADNTASRRGPKVASLVSQDMTLEGGVSGDGELHVDGMVRGDVRVARLTVGETGTIEGSVIAEALECRGRIVGSVSAKQVRLYGSCHVDGDITHEQLAMETGAFFQGRSLKFQRQGQNAGSAPNSELRVPAPPAAH